MHKSKAGAFQEISALEEHVNSSDLASPLLIKSTSLDPGTTTTMLRIAEQEAFKIKIKKLEEAIELKDS